MVMGGGVKLIETMSQNMQFFFWTASLIREMRIERFNLSVHRAM